MAVLKGMYYYRVIYLKQMSSLENSSSLCYGSNRRIALASPFYGDLDP